MTASIKRRKYDHKLYKASSNLESLKLFSIKENLPNYIDMINSGEKSTVDALYELTEKEMDLKEKKSHQSLCTNSWNSIRENNQ